jgi:RNA polymerase primary sigma factor
VLESQLAARLFLEATIVRSDRACRTADLWRRALEVDALESLRQRLLELEQQRLRVVHAQGPQSARPRTFERLGAEVCALLEPLDAAPKFITGIAKQHQALLRRVREEPGLARQQGLDVSRLAASGVLIKRATLRLERVQATLVLSNRKLIEWVASSYASRPSEFADLVQEGTLGFLAALVRFDPSLGYRLSTYATWWIRQSIVRSLEERASTVRVPTRVQRLHRHLNRRLSSSLHESGHAPSDQELAQEVGLPLAKIEAALQRGAAFATSLDAPIMVGDQSSSTLLEFVTDTSTPSVEEQLCAADNQQHALKRMLKLLSERERFVICERFGLNADESERTLEAIGAELNLTRERVRQIEAAGLRKLRLRASRF